MAKFYFFLRQCDPDVSSPGAAPPGTNGDHATCPAPKSNTTETDRAKQVSYKKGTKQINQVDKILIKSE